MTSTYYVSFRLHNKTINGKTYDERRQDLVANANDNQGLWDDTTSFLIVESNLDTNAFSAKVCSGLSASHDTVLVFDTSDMSACCFGKIEHLDVLKSFFPTLKKIA
ncbi:hypothetical protein V1291_004848 [Nitrobacteraceae bacterium AZCC 1564]